MSNDPIIQSARDKIYMALDALGDGRRRNAISYLLAAAEIVSETIKQHGGDTDDPTHRTRQS